jgi:hypothetical protein
VRFNCYFQVQGSGRDDGRDPVVVQSVQLRDPCVGHQRHVAEAARLYGGGHPPGCDRHRVDHRPHPRRRQGRHSIDHPPSALILHVSCNQANGKPCDRKETAPAADSGYYRVSEAIWCEQKGSGAGRFSRSPGFAVCRLVACSRRDNPSPRTLTGPGRSYPGGRGSLGQSRITASAQVSGANGPRRNPGGPPHTQRGAQPLER